MSSMYLLSVLSPKLKQDAALPTCAKSVFIRKHGWYTRLVLEHEDLGRGLGRPEFLVRDFEYCCSYLICIQSIQPYFRGFIIYEKQAFQSCALPNLDLKTFIQYTEYFTALRKFDMHRANLNSVGSTGQNSGDTK